MLHTFLETICINPQKVTQYKLLEEALTHKSYAADFSNDIAHSERLEFLGDAILGAIVAKILWIEHPDRSEATMTLHKIALVREETLALVAENIWLWNIVLVSKWEEKMGGRKKHAILSDTLEALIGYIWIDLWEDAVYAFVYNYIYNILDTIPTGSIKSNKTQLQERLQKNKKIIPSYSHHIQETDNKKNTTTYRADVLANDTVLASGYGNSKKKAEEDAAGHALATLKTWQA